MQKHSEGVARGGLVPIVEAVADPARAVPMVDAEAGVSDNPGGLLHHCNTYTTFAGKDFRQSQPPAIFFQCWIQ